MILVGYINDGNPVFSVTEKANVDMVIALLMNDYIGKVDIQADMFTNKLLSVVDGKIVSTDTEVNVSINDGVLETFEATAENYKEEASYFFDNYTCYDYLDGNYRELPADAYALVTCKECGEKIFTKNSVNGYCVNCFVSKGVNKMLDDAQAETSEGYTEYENLSKVFNTVDTFKSNIKKYANVKGVSEKAKEVMTSYIKGEKLPEKYAERILGGIAA